MSESKKEEKLKDTEDVDQLGHPKIPYCDHYDKQLCDSRKKWAEKFGSCSLEQCGQWWLNEGTHDSCSCMKLKENIENPIGLAKVPLGLCGPLLIRGNLVQGYCLCPLATTESGVVASVTRGATALSRSGGVHVRVLEQTQIQSPYFLLHTSVEVDIFVKWLAKNFGVMQQRVCNDNQLIQLKKMENTHFGRAVVVHFYYCTVEACGQNMVTSCTNNLCKWIQYIFASELPEVEMSYYLIETGLSGDKRIEFVNHWRTRGCRVQAEAWIPKSVMKSVLKVDISMLMACYEAFKSSMCAEGVKGFSVNVSSLVTGVCIATGQDAASVESGNAKLTISPLTEAEWKDLGKKLDKDLDDDEGYAGVYVTILLPSLSVRTVGGGTSLATQRECLNLVGCGNKKATGRLCEVIAGYALGLEISTLSSIANGQFAFAHDELVAIQPEQLGFRESDLNTTFFSSVLGSDCTLIDAIPFDVDAGNSILSNLSKVDEKKVGHFGYTVKYSANGQTGSINTVIKSKTTGLEVAQVLCKIAQKFGPVTGAEFDKHMMEIGFLLTDICEIEIYRIPELRRFIPRIYHTQMIPHKEVFVIVMEHLSDKVTHMDTVEDISVWTISDIKVVLHDLAALHAIHLNKTAKFEASTWIDVIPGEKLVQFWTAFLKASHSEFPRFWTDKRFRMTNHAIKNFGDIESILMTAPRTLIHNDCNPRNICLRKVETIGGDGIFSTPADSCRLCLYDWELALIGTPQRDMFEFLSFTLKPSTPIETWLELVHFYRDCLEEETGLVYPRERFVKVLTSAAWDFAIKRLLMYMVPCLVKEYSFMGRVMDSAFTYLEHAFNCGDQ